jgi:hypothetical protein
MEERGWGPKPEGSISAFPRGPSSCGYQFGIVQGTQKKKLYILPFHVHFILDKVYLKVAIELICFLSFFLSFFFL